MPQDNPSQVAFAAEYDLGTGIRTDTSVNASVRSVLGTPGTNATPGPVFSSNNIQSGSNVGYNSGTGWWMGFDVDGIPKFFIGTSTMNKMTWDGSFLSIVGRLFAINSTISTDFETAARFGTSVAGTGSATFGTNGIDLDTGANANSHAGIKWAPNTLNIFKGSPVFSATFESRLEVNGQMYIGLGDMSGAYNMGGVHHIGFKIIGGNLYATQSGGTESQVLLDTSTPGDVYNIVLRVNGTTSTDFYYRKYYDSNLNSYNNAFSTGINIATNMPTNINSNASMIVDNLAVAADTRMLVNGVQYSV